MSEWAMKRSTKNADGCWVWNLVRDRHGYGKARYMTRQGLAHRISWEIAHGPLSEEFALHHKCRNRACINPAHLEILPRRTHQQMHSKEYRRPLQEGERPKSGHGSLASYSRDKCRCGACREAWNSYMRELRRKKNS